MLNRRHLLAGGAAVAASASFASLAVSKALAAAAPPPSDPAEAAKLNALMDDIMQRTPMTATLDPVTVWKADIATELAGTAN